MRLTHVAATLTLVLAAWQGASSEAQGTSPGSPPPPQVGDAIPALRLNDDHGDAIALGGERETWTVLAFYPKALTPG